ncbi:Gfo/Idh/MocA family oxidoreductase, partial [Rhizobium leguminosarum]|uniref:Gfo/Idh/MocA family oxidoreductase n=1 Tax=Rhizobium leguminosarum TaxID=384 RepID=UPI003F9CBD65
RFLSLEEAIAWGEFDSATNVTPDRIHHPTTMALIAAGKHLFCEKPLAENYAKALEMTEAAESRSGSVSTAPTTVTPSMRGKRASWFFAITPVPK